MNAPERVLKAVNHEEPDRVPAFESAFTNNTIMAHYGITVRSLTKIPKVPKFILKKGSENKKILKTGMKDLYEFYRRAGLDLVPSVASLFPRKILKGGIILDEYGRLMRNEAYKKDGTVIYGYVGGFFKSFED